MSRAPSRLWDTFKPGMSTADLVTASVQCTGTCSKFLIAACRTRLERKRDDAGVFRFYWKGEPPPEKQATVLAEFRPLRRAFVGPAIIPVRAGGRVAGLDLAKPYERG